MRHAVDRFVILSPTVVCVREGAGPAEEKTIVCAREGAGPAEEKAVVCAGQGAGSSASRIAYDLLTICFGSAASRIAYDLLRKCCLQDGNETA